MARRGLDRRKVKIHRSYTIDEAARTIGAAKGTVRRWIDKGLPAIRDRKPILILGADLSDYMAGRTRPKRHCPPGTCYCVKCKDARRPAGDVAEFVPINASSGNLRAICPDCGNLMHRRTSHVQLDQVRCFIDVVVVEAPPRLNDSGAPSTNDHLHKELETHA